MTLAELCRDCFNNQCPPYDAGVGTATDGGGCQCCSEHEDPDDWY